MIYFINISYSQKIEFGIDFGYGGLLNPSTISEGSYLYLSESRSERGITKYTFGEGLNAGIFIDYPVLENVMLYLNLSYSKSWRIIQNIKQKDLITGNNLFRRYAYFGSLSRVVMGLKLVHPFYSNFHLRLGFISSFYPIFYQEYNSTDKPKTYLENKYFGGNSFGFTSSIGYRIKLSNHFSIVPEVRGFYQSYSPNNRETVTFMIDGEDRLESLDNWIRYTNYVDKYDKKGFGIDKSKPSTELRRFYPFSSIGLNISLIYGLK